MISHTHSGPARFLPLFEASEALLGPFGIGTFRQEVFDRVVDSAVAAAVAAIDAAQPAQLGWTIAEGFDVDDKIAADRRPESPPFDDNRALLVRVDDDAGLPLFVLFGFGVHPTENGSDWSTNDVAGGVERAVERLMFPLANRVVPALFLQSNAGSMAPTAGGQGYAVPAGNDHAGAVFVDRVGELLTTLETKRDVVVKSRAHRFFVNAPALGYAPGDWVNNGNPPFGGEVTYGGMNCFVEDFDDAAGDYSGHLTRDDMSCGISLHTFLFNHPPSVFERTQMNAIDLDGLAIVTTPGELTMEGAWSIAAELERKAGLDPLSTFTLGYSNDHLMYLLPTSLDEDAPPWPGYTGPAPSSYPPFAFSVFRGGFEADTSIWGDLMGDYLKAHAVTAWQRLVDGADASSEIAPAVFSPNVKDPIPVDETPAAHAGEVVVDVASVVARRAPVEFAFVGGDVAVEGNGPVVTLLHDDDTPVLLPSGRPFSTQHAVFPLSMKRDRDGVWTWTARLELPADFPAGRYRLGVAGRAVVDGAVVAYDADSAVFDVGGGALAVDVVRDGADLVVFVGWPTDAPVIDGATLTGALGLVDPRVPSGHSAPLAAGTLPAGAVRATSGKLVLEGSAGVEEQKDGFPITVSRIENAGPGAFVVDVEDSAGNRGSAAVEAAE